MQDTLELMKPLIGREATLLAFDYGEKRIGVAIGNLLTREARALAVVPNRNREYRFEAVGKLIGEWKPDALVVGLPSHPDGTPHEMTRLAKRFGNQLNGRFNLPVNWVDERYSSVEAEAGLREKGASLDMLDAEAARIILQQYLDGHGLSLDVPPCLEAGDSHSRRCTSASENV